MTLAMIPCKRTITGHARLHSAKVFAIVTGRINCLMMLYTQASRNKIRLVRSAQNVKFVDLFPYTF